MNNLEQVKQVVETIKTLNINFNDATTQKIAEAIIPVFKWYIFQNIFVDVLTFLGVVTGIVLSYMLIKKWIDYEYKSN